MVYVNEIFFYVLYFYKHSKHYFITLNYFRRQRVNNKIKNIQFQSKKKKEPDIQSEQTLFLLTHMEKGVLHIIRCIL